MNRRLFLGASMAIATLSATLVRAQTAPAPATKPTEEAVKLDPFTVNASSDIGFVAASSLAGGRIATALKDTPIAYSVVTSEFLDAFNITDISTASQWTPSANSMEGDGSQRLFARTVAYSITLRGVRIGLPQQNFFPMYGTSDSYIVDRVDVPRGPNGVVIGNGAVGGVVNSVTKQAILARDITELRLQLGSYSRKRATLDVNRPVNDKLALRANAMWEAGETWRDNEWNKKYGVDLTGTYQLSPSLSLRAELQYNDQKQNTFTLVQDNMSAWDGKTYNFSAPLTGAGAPTSAFLAQAGLARQTKLLFTSNPGFGLGHAVLNFQNNFNTVGAGYSSTAGNSNYIDGVQIKTVNFNNNGQPIIDNHDGIPYGTRFKGLMGGSPFFQVPARSFTTLWTGSDPSYTESLWNKSLFLNWHPVENLYVEVAANQNNSSIMGNASQRRGGTQYLMDIARTLPTGAPNPNFLRPYEDYHNYAIWRRFNYQTLRTQVVYSKDTAIGKFQVGFVAGITREKETDRAKVLLLPITNNALWAPDARPGVTESSDIKSLGYFTRLYDGQDRLLNLSAMTQPVAVIDPVANTTTSVVPQWILDINRTDRVFDNQQSFKYLQSAMNLDLFKNRLVLIAAGRRDFTRLSTQQVLLPGDMPAGWDGQSYVFKPEAPADYFDLQYAPKDATGKVTGPAQGAAVRPRQTVQNVSVPLAQYAGDRFQDDYSPPTVTNNVNTFTLGAVVNATRNIGIYGNVATTFDLSPPVQLVDGRVGRPSASRGKEYGLRFNLPNGRMSFSIGRFTSFQKDAIVTLPGGFTGDENNIANSPVVGDLSAGGQNVRGLKTFTSAIRSVVTNRSDGYEMELTANFTNAWRVTLNGSHMDTKISDQYPDVIGYIKNTDAVLRQILTDSGVVIDANNVARIPTALDDPTKINQQRVQAAVNGWNDLQTNVIPNLTAQVPQPGIGSVKWTGNLGTDYRFSKGPVAGLRIGLGVQYRTGQVVGYRGGDTIVDPANPNRAIPDPTVSGATPLYGTSYYKGVATFSYTYKLRETGRMAPKSIQFDLTIDNLFNREDPIYANVGNPAAGSPTRMVPRDGNWASPAAITVAGDPSYLMPRNYMLSAKFSF